MVRFLVGVSVSRVREMVGLLFRFFLFFLASAEFAAGLLAMVERTTVEAFSLGGARRVSNSSWAWAALARCWSVGRDMAPLGGGRWLLTWFGCRRLLRHTELPRNARACCAYRGGLVFSGAERCLLPSVALPDDFGVRLLVCRLHWDITLSVIICVPLWWRFPPWVAA